MQNAVINHYRREKVECQFGTAQNVVMLILREPVSVNIVELDGKIVWAHRGIGTLVWLRPKNLVVRIHLCPQWLGISMAE